MKFKIFIFIVDIVNLSFKAKFYFYKKNLNLKKNHTIDRNYENTLMLDEFILK